MRPTIAAPAKRRRRLTLFRPAYALLAFGALTAGSTWLWFGQGLFIPRLAGLLLMGGLGLSGGGAAVALLRRRRPLVALALFLAMAVALPLLILVAYRMKTGVPILMHDGAYQTEEAIRFVLSGQNPYGRDYSRTSMRLWHWYVNTPLDPSLFHYVYYPATFLLPLPFAALSVALHLPFDVRLVWLGAIGVGGWALWAMPWRWEWRYVALCALFLDPLFYFPQGRNDILWLAGITLGLLAFSRGRLRLAALAFGAALAFKPFAVFFAILIAVAIVRRCGGRRPLRTAGILAGLAVPAALTIGPFFLWNPAAFWADTVAFVAGTDPHSYPMGGVGLAGLLLALHVIPSPTAQIPLSLLQAGLTLPALGFAGRQVWRRPSPAGVVVGGTVVLALFLLCARFVNDNYLASLVYLAVLAGAAGRGHVAANPAQTPAVTPQAA